MRCETVFGCSEIGFVVVVVFAVVKVGVIVGGGGSDVDIVVGDLAVFVVWSMAVHLVKILLYISSAHDFSVAVSGLPRLRCVRR